MSKQIFDPAQVRVLSLMESDSLSTFLSSSTLKELQKRIRRGEMDKLVQEDIESVKDIMSKEVSESKEVGPSVENSTTPAPTSAAAALGSGTVVVAAVVVTISYLQLFTRKYVWCIPAVVHCRSSGVLLF